MASSTERLVLYANWKGSITDAMWGLRCARTKCSNAFMATEVSATGLKSFRQLALEDLGTGMIVDDLKHCGTIL